MLQSSSLSFGAFNAQLRLFGLRLLGRLLSLWIRPQSTQPDKQQPTFHGAQPVCYLLEQRSITDLIALSCYCRRQQLPDPLGRSNPDLTYGWLEGVRKAPCTPLKTYLSGLEPEALEQLQLIPASLFWGRAPSQERSTFKLLLALDSAALLKGFKKGLAVLFNGRQLQVQLEALQSGASLYPETLQGSARDRYLSRHLRLQFRAIRLAAVGPDLSQRAAVIHRVLTNPQVREQIKNQAGLSGRNVAAVRAEAERYASEIASDYNYSVLRLFDRLLSWFWNKIYSGVNVHHSEPLQQLARDHSIVYVPCHRSHIDYLLLSYVLFYQGLTPPHVAAGINLNMPLIGTLLRRAGAFFIRRTFRGQPLYTSVFNAYLQTLLARGFPLEFFVEGGRSRTGRTLSPKLGMLMMTLQGYLRERRKPLVFVPVYIGYERVFEGGTYLGELRGKKKQKESPLTLLRSLRALKRSFGQVELSFGQAIHLDQLLAESTESLDPERSDTLKPVCQQLAQRIATGINSSVAVNAVNLVALCLLETPRQTLDRQSLEVQIDRYRRLLKECQFSSQITLPDEPSHHLLDRVLELGLVQQRTDGLGTLIEAPGNQAVLLTYYRNNVQHLLTLPALIASLVHHGFEIERGFLERLLLQIYPYLQAELFLPWSDDQLSEMIEHTLHAMTRQELIRVNGRCYLPPAPDSVNALALQHLAELCSHSLQRYYMVISLLEQHGSNRLNSEALEQRCNLLAQRLASCHGINAPEFSDTRLFRQFVSQLIQRDVLSLGPADRLCFDQRIPQIVDRAALLLSPAVRQSIRQIVLHPQRYEA